MSETLHEIEDEFDRKGIDQLHAVTLQFSAQCFESKKLCATVLVASATLISTFTGKALNFSIFVGGAFVIGVFWLLDAYNYYYQERVRAQMSRIADNVRARAEAVQLLGTATSTLENGPKGSGIGMPVSPGRRSETRRWLRSLFNSSMIFYLILIIADSALASLFLLGKFAN